LPENEIAICVESSIEAASVASAMLWLDIKKNPAAPTVKTKQIAIANAIAVNLPAGAKL
jgi:hypothetical protein